VVFRLNPLKNLFSPEKVKYMKCVLGDAFLKFNMTR
jgi:hypothetical protein